MSAPDLRVYRGAVQTAPGVWLVTYACGLAFRERTVTARVMRHERVTFIDWVGGDIPDAVVDEPLRFALSADVDAAEKKQSRVLTRIDRRALHPEFVALL